MKGHGHIIPNDDGSMVACAGAFECPECEAEWNSLPPHMRRVVDESGDLRIKLQALLKFEESTVFSSLPVGEQTLLKQQETAMGTYLSILEQRLRATRQTPGGGVA